VPHNPGSCAPGSSRERIWGRTAEWGARGVCVDAVAPTSIETPSNAFVKSDPRMYDARIGGTPMARLGQVDEIASVVLFLVSEAASLMTGSIVLVDGGYTCR
jgi:NAD(P)-dependent dehydrogenase (short-subunit alcohol dehydrogenase family)